MSLYPPMPTLGQPIAPPPIDTSSPDDSRTSFRDTDYDAAVPLIRARFPNIDPLYITKIFRGTVRAEGLIWLDVDREDASPPDFPDLAHLLYCFEIYGQMICIFVGPQQEIELQRALSDYRIRLLKLSKVASFESLREWHKATLEAQFRDGQDRVEGWRERREEFGRLLKKKM